MPVEIDLIAQRANAATARIALEGDAALNATAKTQREIALDQLPWTLTETERLDAVMALETIVSRVDAERLTKAEHAVSSAIRSLSSPLPSLSPDARLKADRALTLLLDVALDLTSARGQGR